MRLVHVIVLFLVLTSCGPKDGHSYELTLFLKNEMNHEELQEVGIWASRTLMENGADFEEYSVPATGAGDRVFLRFEYIGDPSIFESLKVYDDWLQSVLSKAELAK